MNVLGIDIGTTSLSFVVMDINQNLLKKSLTIKNNSFFLSDNSFEKTQDPEFIWEEIKKVLSDLQNDNNEITKIKGIGLTGQMHGMLYIDEKGNAVSPLYTWQDASGNQIYQKNKSYVQILSEQAGYQMATGFGSSTYYVHRQKNSVPKSAVSFCTIMDYIGMKLTNRTSPLMHTSNAASFGLFDVEHLHFDKLAIEKVGLNFEMFPKVSSSIEILGYYQDEIPVLTAIGDNQASFFGAVKNWEESVLVNVGTGSQISFVVNSFVEAEEMETRPFAENKYLLVSSPLCGGRAYAMLADFYQSVLSGFLSYSNIAESFNKEGVYNWMDKLLEENFSRIQKENILKIHPNFSGTRKNPSVKGSITGIDTTNFTPESFIYGMLLGIAENLYESFIKCPEDIKTGKLYLVGSGNGIRKNIYLQKIFEEMFQLPLSIPNSEEEAASGAALLFCDFQ